MTRVIGYIRVSTDEQADSGLGLAAQRESIKAEAQRRGWTVEWFTDEGYSAKNMERPGIQSALAALEDGGPGVLVVAKLDRLSRSLVDFANLMARAGEQGWELVSLDLGVDTTTPTGRFVANLMANVAQLERELISQRTKEALAARKRQGVKLGRPRDLDAEVRGRILREHEQGRGFTAIARSLNSEGVPTARDGKRWYPATVRAVVLAEAA